MATSSPAQAAAVSAVEHVRGGDCCRSTRIPDTVAAMPFSRYALTVAQCVNIERLARIAGELGCEIEWRDLGSQRRGEYVDRLRLIRLSPRLRGFQVVRTLSHEIVHAMFRDRGGDEAAEARARRMTDLISGESMLHATGALRIPIVWPPFVMHPGDEAHGD